MNSAGKRQQWQLILPQLFFRTLLHLKVGFMCSAIAERCRFSEAMPWLHSKEATSRLAITRVHEQQWQLILPRSFSPYPSPSQGRLYVQCYRREVSLQPSNAALYSTERVEQVRLPAADVPVGYWPRSFDLDRQGDYQPVNPFRSKLNSVTSTIQRYLLILKPK